MPTGRMPAQWEPHARCLMAWPGRAGPWGRLPLDAVQADYAAIAHAIRRFEPVTMIVDPAYVVAARDQLGGDIDLLELPTNEAWFRDTGPAFVRRPDGGVSGALWRFNGWGGASPDYAPDAVIARRFCEALGLPFERSALAFEGGAMDVDGEGAMLTTRSVVFADNRNPGITQEAAEAEFARLLGVGKTIWLPGDGGEFGTSGHVDGIARFVRPGVVLFERSASDDPERRAVERANLRALEGATDARGRPIALLFVTDGTGAAPRGGGWGECRSYVNFYIANGGVVLPAYGAPQDAAAAEAIAAAFPDREAVQVDVARMARGGGAIHCVTQQLPL